jgi:proteasome assembly chaperone (PAC2) family protein
MNILDFEVDVTKLEERAKKTEKILSRLREEQKLRKVSELEEEEEELSYIG